MWIAAARLRKDKARSFAGRDTPGGNGWLALWKEMNEASTRLEIIEVKRVPLE